MFNNVSNQKKEIENESNTAHSVYEGSFRYLNGCSFISRLDRIYTYACVRLVFSVFLSLAFILLRNSVQRELPETAVTLEGHFPLCSLNTQRISSSDCL